LKTSGNLGTSKYDLAKVLVPALLTTSKKHLDGEQVGYMHGFSDLYRAVQVSLMLKSGNLLNSCTTALNVSLLHCEQKNEYRWVIEISEILRLVANSPMKEYLLSSLRDFCLF
jgi:hypothetical protein